MEYAKKAKLGTVKTGWRVPTAAEFTTIFPATCEPFKDTGYKEWDIKDPVPAEARNYWPRELDTRLKDYAYVYHWYGPGGGPNNCRASQNFVNVRLVHDPLGKRRGWRGGGGMGRVL